MDILSQVGYGILAVVVVISALGMILSRNAIYAALLLALNFLSVAVIYLVLGAPFIALVQITVYAGSIMVLFMFVVMLLGAEFLTGGEPIRGQRVLAVILGVILAVEAGILLVARGSLWDAVSPFNPQTGNPAAIGMALFTQYPLLLIATSVLLLTATVGAILITRGEAPLSRDTIAGKEQ
jgi:NADH-quinone oxidoreductase subunit J